MVCQRGAFTCCNTIKSKRCHGNSNVKLKLYSLLFDIHILHVLIQCDRKETN